MFDAYAVPHVYARDPDDAWFSAGVLHARERLWQMELYRRVTAGRLSEVLGEATLPIDKRFLTLNLRAAAEAEWERASPEVKAALERYAAGVNAVAGGLVSRASDRSRCSSWASRRRPGRPSIRCPLAGCWRGAWRRTTNLNWSGPPSHRSSALMSPGSSRGGIRRTPRPSSTRSRSPSQAPGEGAAPTTGGAVSLPPRQGGPDGGQAPVHRQRRENLPAWPGASSGSTRRRNAATATTGCSRARGRAPGGRCWPTTRTCWWSFRRSGTRCTWWRPAWTSSA